MRMPPAAIDARLLRFFFLCEREKKKGPKEKLNRVHTLTLIFVERNSGSIRKRVRKVDLLTPKR